MIKYMRLPATSIITLLVGCQPTMPIIVQRIEVASPSKASATTPPNSVVDKKEAEPGISSPSASATPTLLATSTPSSQPSVLLSAATGIKVSGHVWGHIPGNTYARSVLVNDDPDARVKNDFTTIVKPSADGKTYMTVNTTGISRIEKDKYEFPFSRPKYGGNLAPNSIKTMTIEIPNDQPEYNVDLFMSYPIAQGMGEVKPGHLFLNVPGNFNEVRKTFHVAPCYKNGEGQHAEVMLGFAEALKLWERLDATIETDGRTSVDIGGLENDRWYAVYVDLKLPNGQATTTTQYFLAGRRSSTALVTNPKGYTEYNMDQKLTAPMLTSN